MDLLLTRYGASVLDLSFDIGMELIQEGLKKELDNKIWQMWLTKYPWMDSDSFISYENFKNNIVEQKPKEVIKTKEEILSQSEVIIAAWKKGGVTNGAI